MCNLKSLKDQNNRCCLCGCLQLLRENFWSSMKGCVRGGDGQDIQFYVIGAANKTQYVVLSGSSQYRNISNFGLALLFPPEHIKIV